MSIKTTAEIEAMRQGGKILGLILHELAEMTKPGITTMDLEKRAETLFAKHNVQPSFKGYRGFPAILCTSVNHEVVHAIPNKNQLHEGDILSIDCGVFHKGLHTDSAIAVTVGEANPEAKKLVQTCIRALWAGINQVKPGNHVGDISNAIETVTRQAGFTPFKDLTGHGIGHELHEEPHIFNFGKRGTGLALKPGMTMAIEPIISAGSIRLQTLDDDWTLITSDHSLAIQHEHTVLVTGSGVEVLTLRPYEKSQ